MNHSRWPGGPEASVSAPPTSTEDEAAAAVEPHPDAASHEAEMLVPEGGARYAGEFVEKSAADRLRRAREEKVPGMERVPESIPLTNDRRERAVQAISVGAPLLAVGAAAWLAWGHALRWSDLVVFGVMYVLTGLGITLGYHRLFTHRSFKTTRGVRAALAVLGSMAVQGSVVEWTATHRKHHVHSDEPGDPHSPHLHERRGWRGAFEGLVYAHVGWVFRGKDRANPARYARDLLADRDIRLIGRTFPLWVVAGLALSFGLGVALSGTVVGGLTGLLWGGGARIFLLHHATFSINSLCHFFGRQEFRTGDESRNLAWLAPITLGEAWHNNHHAFPTSARHGLGRWQLDPTARIIDLLGSCHLAWDIVRVSPERRAVKELVSSR